MRRTALDVILFALLACSPAGAEPSADDVLKGSGIRGGLVVHLGCGDGELTIALRAGESFLVQGLDADPANVEKTRSRIRSLGLGGKVSADRFDGRHLPYVDNLVNLLVAEDLGTVAMPEVMRVLAPSGVAYLKQNGTWSKTVKPWPDEIDEWTHYLHGPDNNAVAHDELVAAPYHVQWVAGPRWARHHNHLSTTSAMVCSGGRVFAIMDFGPIASLAQAPEWRLVARDAFSGVLLWNKPIGPWEGVLRPFRSGPVELARRLVAVGDRVYVTPGYGEPVVALDAATGRLVRKYGDTNDAVEIVCHRGVLYVVAGSIDRGQYAEARRRGAASPPPRNKRLLAVEAESGKLLWKKADGETGELLPATLGVSDGRAFFQGTGQLVCLDAATGEPVWKAPRPVAVNRFSWSAPTLVIHGGVVLSADCAVGKRPEGTTGDGVEVRWQLTARPENSPASRGELVAFSATDGRELWRCPAAQGYNTPADVFVADGLVWTSYVPGRNEPDFAEGRDLHTGEVKRRLDTGPAFTTTHHHRCYRDKATDRFILLGRTGVEFIDLSGAKSQRHCWVRGACQYGVMPACGMLYAPPHACACYIQSKLAGFWALAPRGRTKDEVARMNAEGGRLERGDAYDSVQRSSFITHPSTDWPTHRHDAGRTGRTPTAVPTQLKPAWQTEIGGRLTAPVIAGGKVLVAAVGTHAVHALDARTGKPAWSYSTGGRIDSPPTIDGGLCLFGSADGYVYCLRLTDGALVWRYRAARVDRRVVAFDQLESVWPATGSVLVHEGVVYCTAGRSSFLDGGMSLSRLDVSTGKLLGITRFDSRDPETGEEPEAIIEDTELPGALPDVLVYDGRHLFLRDKVMDLDGVEQPGYRPHLYSSAGLLDDAWWHRTYWQWAERTWGRASGWAVMSRIRPSGRLLVADEETVLGYGRKSVGGNSLRGYHLFRADKKVTPIDKQIKNNNLALMKYQKPAKVHYHWTRDVPLVVRAMVLAGDVLFTAGPAYHPAAATEPTFTADSPAVLVAFRPDDGEEVSRLKLESQPVFDGMAAAGGRVFLSTVDGKTVCLE